MEHAEKLYIKPQAVQHSFNETTTAKPEPTNPFQRLENILKIVLRIASVKGYNDNGQIRGVNGQYLEKSNVVQLLNHAVKKSKLISAENDFIHLLKEAKVLPDLITNENVKSKIVELVSSSKSLQNSNASVIVQRSETVKEPSPNIKIVQPVKRKLEDFEDENDDEKVIKRPALDWITADGISSDDEY